MPVVIRRGTKTQCSTAKANPARDLSWTEYKRALYSQISKQDVSKVRVIGRTGQQFTTAHQ